jgi:peptidoglycan/xylan/chitin deacetylase (PgdA/CDA1 family)
VRPYHAAPTFFIPATVLERSPGLIRRIQRAGAEIGIHGYVHNDYRTLTKEAQARQTRDAISVFDQAQVRYLGFRNPYLGWDERSLEVFRNLGLTYDSNEAVLHEVLNMDALAPALADSFERSLALFQAIPCTEYNLRPHTEDGLLRIPTSIPDDEMLFDRLQITDAARLGDLWCEIMQRVYDAGGIYVLNLHPERGALARGALDALLRSSCQRALPVWVARLSDVAGWWRERAATSLQISAVDTDRWQIEARGSSRATLLARNVAVEGAETVAWPGGDLLVKGHAFSVTAAAYPGVALSQRTPADVEQMLREQGYPTRKVASAEEALAGAFVDRPDGLGATRQERQRAASALVREIEQGAAPLVRVGLWPEGRRAALSISGDIDSVTIQDFFLRILEVRKFAMA